MGKNPIIYIVGEEHPEGLLLGAINKVDDNIPTEKQLKEWGMPDLINHLVPYRNVMGKYFFRKEHSGREYLDGSKEILFEQETEKTFWEELFKAVENIYPLRPIAIEDSLKEIKAAKEILGLEKELIRQKTPTAIFREGTGGDIYGISGVIHIAAQTIGASVVYLDEGFENFNNPDRWECQNGREQYWIGKIIQNPPEGDSLLFAGINHLKGKRPGIPYIGEFLDLLGERGISYDVLEPITRQRRL